jgi:hypothetical protein
MNTNPITNRVTQASATSRLEAAGAAGPGQPAAATPNVQVDVDELLLGDRIRWGPILAGVVAGIAVLLVLSLLGIALRISTPRSEISQTWGTGAGIWGGVTLLIAFFVGGWVTARSVTTLSEADGPLNGFVTGAAILSLLLWLATTTAAGVMGFFVVAVATIAGGATATQAAAQNAGPGAWGAVIALVLAVVAATLGGVVGQNPRLALPSRHAVATAH